MHAPAPIDLLVDEQVVLHGRLLVLVEHLLLLPGHVPDDDEAWHEKVGASVVAGPVAIVRLEHLVPGHGPADGVEGVVGLACEGGHLAPFLAPGLHALLAPELIPRIGVNVGVEADVRLPRHACGAMPNLPPSRLTCEHMAVVHGLLGDLVALLGHGTAPAAVEEPLLVLPLSLPQDAVGTRTAGMARVVAAEVVYDEERGSDQTCGKAHRWQNG